MHTCTVNTAPSVPVFTKWNCNQCDGSGFGIWFLFLHYFLGFFFSYSVTGILYRYAYYNALKTIDAKKVGPVFHPYFYLGI
jgi:hypothetical protein